MSFVFLTNHSDVAVLPIAKFRWTRNVVKTNWWNFSKLYEQIWSTFAHLTVQSAPFTHIPVLLHIIANPTIPLHILVANALDNISSFHYKQFTRPKRVIDWTNYWQYDSFSQRSFIQLYPKNVPKKVFSILFFYQFNVELSEIV